MRNGFFLSLVLAAGAFGQNPSTGLTVVSATRTSVQLTWKGDPSATNGYVVQRQVLGASDFAPIGNAVTATSATDNNIDPEATYLYQVVSVAGNTLSAPSGSVIAGPAPYGYSTVVPDPASLPDSEQGNFGESLSMCLDGNGDPAVAYEWDDAQNLGDDTTSTIFFTRWNRAKYQWMAPMQIAVVGANQGNGGIQPPYTLGIGCDASNGNFGVAYNTQGSSRIDYALSIDGGQTWKIQTVVNNDEIEAIHPRLALANGTAFFAALDLSDSVVNYFTGPETAAPSAWTQKTVPNIAGGATLPFGLDVDSAGNPGVAFWEFPNDGSDNATLAFWRPTFANSIKAGDSGNQENDSYAAALAFSGTSPRIGVVAHRTPLDNSNGQTDSGIYSVAASDTGQAWASMVQIPQDGGEFYNGDVAIGTGSKNQGTLLFSTAGGSGDPAPTCGDPKTATTTNFVTWTTCAPSGPNGPSLQDAAWFSAKYDPSDNLYISFTNVDNTDVTPGVVVFRQPPPGAGTPPQINPGGVTDGATFKSPIAEGSIASIFGTNFIGAATGAGATPLPRELGGVTVLVNGQPAPLIYVGINQINFQMPYESPTGTVNVQVVSNRLSSNLVIAQVAAVQPQIFTHSQNIAAVQADGQDTVIVQPGTTVVLYATGCGATTPTLPTGYAALSSPLSNCGTTTATVGGQNAPVSFSGLTPGFAGLAQINLTIPPLANGTYPIQITVSGVKSSPANIQVAN